MSSAGGKRRSLLTNAIESIGTTPVPTPIAKDDGQDLAVQELPGEEPAAPSFLERRGIAFDEIARTVKRPTIRLKPSECSIWRGNARDYAALSYDRCSSLIESIREEGTNREPVVVRRTPNSDRPYELIVGTRRHFCVSWLHANNHSEIELVARIETLDDEGAFRLADLENREREDVTDLERARNYRHAVDAYYGGVRTQMADRLAIPKQNLHNLLQLSELPDEVVSAFADPGDIKVRHGMRLAPLLKDERHRDGIVAAAIEIAAEQAALRNAGADRIEGSKVCERLAGAAQPTKAQPARRAKAALTMAGGAQIGQILVDTRAKGITVNINPRGAASIDEILETLRPVLEAAKFTR
ncbi:MULTISPECIES: ParB/RepB/Spo0J family partition protein [Sphingomonadaceae]|jgi:ParB family chromosome partitioning protein|uniref:Chromosome partitioning protein n=2 Tax=Sphingobium TaxID=165695 RepID=A0A249MZQ1_SPHXE|nr:MULTISPECIES: ParB/RepB/Spo0J family partition protein [Sphingomonadaceae]MBJ7442351.1 ParB/RepB/Spo0J family partition protein [Sphingopyxis sp.]ASY46853.1 chromosome partitioning protein [Sphingobium xenophagum]QGP81559.1 ParB/RepB/Spo0J family partition protein [Sphingobium sp. CAP-1]QWT16748.1 ParB/RepB/Spo0J family partition protein [Sphingobium xenophagum]RYM08491.1 ParB/RepB/Spo0J family partition protein [Sphingobium cupriresistens]|tara:strand:- start:9033 stop:10100 length:1068 start_codon:yes stop_codon:yes gene_type:complete